MGFFSDFVGSVKETLSGAVEGVKGIGSDFVQAGKDTMGAVAENPLMSGMVTAMAGTVGGPWGAAMANAALSKKRGASWGRALASGATSYGAQTWAGGNQTTGMGDSIDYGDGSAFAGDAGSSYSGYDGAGLSGGSSIDYGDGSSFPSSGGGEAYQAPPDVWDYSRYTPEVAGSADAGFGQFVEDFGIADLGGGRENLFGGTGPTGWENNLIESTTPMYDDFYTNPEAWAGYSDEIASAPTDYFTSGTLRDIYSQKARDFLTSAKPWIKVGRGLDDLYAKNRMAKDLKSRQAELEDYRMQLENRINNYYAPGSAEANMMRQAMERRDAAAGRNSQYGTRETQLAAALAQQRAQYAQAMAPSLVNIMGQQTGLNSASSALRRGARQGLWQTAGSLRDLF